MMWEDLYKHWAELHSARRRQDAESVLRDARKRISGNGEDDWRWLIDALSDRARKYFVSDVFRFQPVPKRLFQPFVLAAVVDVNHSNNRGFLDPCVETFGRETVVSELERLRQAGVTSADAYRAAMFWIPPDRLDRSGRRTGKRG